MNQKENEINALINDLQHALEVFESISPGSYTVDACGKIFAAELKREGGPRKTFIKRLKAELVSVAREVLSPEERAEFIQAESGGVARTSDDSVLARILNRGEVLSEKEFNAAMLELNEILQSKAVLSADEEAVVNAVNELLGKFEGKNKQAKLKTK